MKRSVCLILAAAYLSTRLALGLLDGHPSEPEPNGVNLCATHADEHGCDPAEQDHHHHSEHHAGCFVCNLSLGAESALQTPAFLPEAGAVQQDCESRTHATLLPVRTSCRDPPKA